MPHLIGVFDLFSDLDTISAAEFAPLIHEEDHHILENHLANRILYPHTIAQTKQELDFDFIIFGLGVKRHPEIFYDYTQKRLVIPSHLLCYLPPITRLIGVILSHIRDSGISQIWLQEGNNQRVVASCIAKTYIDNLHLPGDLKIIVEGKERILIPNQLNLIPISQNEAKVQFTQETTVTVLGAELGLFIDLREDQG